MSKSNIQKNPQYIKFEDTPEVSSSSNSQTYFPRELNFQVAQQKQQKQQQVGVLQDSEEFSRQEVSFEIYSNEEQRKQNAEDEIEKNLQQKEEERQKKISKCISFIFGVLPLAIMVGIFLLFSFDKDIKQRVVNMFTNIHELNLEISFYLIIYGMLLIFLSFPYLIFEMSLGFTFSFPIAVFFAVVAKLLGEIVCFSLSRYVFKDCCLKFLRMNEYFIVLEKAVKKNPALIANLLRASILVPLFVVNFGSGIIDITFTQYIVPAFLWGTVYSMFAVLCGSQLLSIAEVIENAAFPKNRVLFIFELSMVIISVILMIAIILKSGKMYEDIKAEMQEQIILEKQQQSTKAVDSCTVIKTQKQISAMSQSFAGDEEDAQKKQNSKLQQKSYPAFNAFSLNNNFQNK